MSQRHAVVENYINLDRGIALSIWDLAAVIFFIFDMPVSFPCFMLRHFWNSDY